MLSELLDAEALVREPKLANAAEALGKTCVRKRRMNSLASSVIARTVVLDRHDGRVSFRWKDYRAQNKSKAMTLDANEFSRRRFLTHVLPKGFRRIRHFGFRACRVQKLASRIRAALDVPNSEPSTPIQSTTA